MFVCVSSSIYKFKHVFLGTNVLVEFKNICLCFFIYLSV